jgi:regulator of protease activity HflC (stomatin/prohibitin superfamily)
MSTTVVVLVALTALIVLVLSWRIVKQYEQDTVGVEVPAVAHFGVVDAEKSVVAIENVRAATDQVAQTTLRNAIGQDTFDETLSETDRINKERHPHSHEDRQ